MNASVTITKQYYIRINHDVRLVDVLAENTFRNVKLFVNQHPTHPELIAVSQFDTGLLIASHDTEEQALAEAHLLLNAYTAKQLREIIAEKIAAYGGPANQEPQP